MRWLDGITNAMDMNLSKLWEVVRAGRPGVLQSMGSQKSDMTRRLNSILRSYSNVKSSAKRLIQILRECAEIRWTNRDSLFELFSYFPRQHLQQCTAKTVVSRLPLLRNTFIPFSLPVLNLFPFFLIRFTYHSCFLIFWSHYIPSVHLFLNC